MTQQSRTITRKSASNLALAFVLLPEARREAMSALYAFWREDIRRACHGLSPEFAVNRELQPVIAQYHLPFAHFDELIRGVKMDLDIKRYQTYDELEQYCFRV